MDADRLNKLLSNVRTRYEVHVGDEVTIDLPQVSLTRDTEFVQLIAEAKGDSLVATDPAAAEALEGVLLPDRIQGRAVRPGTSHIVIRAVDALTGTDIQGVTPLDIEVRVKAEQEAADRNLSR